MTSTTTAQLLADLTSATDAVRTKAWLSAEIGGSGASLGLLGSTASPLSALGGAGIGWFTPYVSFLEEPLTHLRGNPGSVSSSARDFDDAGRDITALAGSYRDSTGAETTGWSGDAASSYRDTGARHADGIAALGQANTAVASAISGAGEVVAQVIDAVTQLGSEAVGKIIPIMSKAVAEAPATFGQSIAAAIPVCVQIAVEYGQKILAKLAALLSSGQNLLKLVNGALAVLDLVKQALTRIGQQSTTSDRAPAQGGGANRRATEEPGAAQRSAAAAPGPQGDGSAGSPALAGTPTDSAPAPVASQSFDGNPLSPGNISGASSNPGHPGYPGYPGASTVSPGGLGSATTPAADRPVGVAPFGAGGGIAGGSSVASGSRRSIGPVSDLVTMDARELTAGRPAAGAAGRGAPGMLAGPMGAGARPGEADKEHQRRYPVVERHDEEMSVDGDDESAVIAPQVIGGGQ